MGRRPRVAARDLETLLDSIIPDALGAHEGVDGRVVWVLATLALRGRRRAVEAGMLMDEPEVIGAFDLERAWRLFRAQLALSPAGLEWGGIVRHLARKRS